MTVFHSSGWIWSRLSWWFLLQVSLVLSVRCLSDCGHMEAGSPHDWGWPLADCLGSWGCWLTHGFSMTWLIAWLPGSEYLKSKCPRGSAQRVLMDGRGRYIRCHFHCILLVKYIQGKDFCPMKWGWGAGRGRWGIERQYLWRQATTQRCWAGSWVCDQAGHWPHA